jgi:hypothetical protein
VASTDAAAAPAAGLPPELAAMLGGG